MFLHNVKLRFFFFVYQLQLKKKRKRKRPPRKFLKEGSDTVVSGKYLDDLE